LAALVAISVTPVRATTVSNLTFGAPVDCSVSSIGPGSATGNCSSASISQPSGPNGVKLYTGIDPQFNVVTATSSNGGIFPGYGVSLTTVGSLNGNFTGNLPVAYGFTTKSGAAPLIGINFVLQISLDNETTFQPLVNLASTTFYTPPAPGF